MQRAAAAGRAHTAADSPCSPVASTLTRPSTVTTSPTTQLLTRSCLSSTWVWGWNATHGPGLHAGGQPPARTPKIRDSRPPGRTPRSAFAATSASQAPHLDRAWNAALLLRVAPQQLLHPYLLVVDALGRRTVGGEGAAATLLACGRSRQGKCAGGGVQLRPRQQSSSSRPRQQRLGRSTRPPCQGHALQPGPLAGSRSPAHRVGGANRPSGNSACCAAPHFAQEKSISTIRGRMWLMRTTVPRIVARRPGGGAEGARMGPQGRGARRGRCGPTQACSTPATRTGPSHASWGPAVRRPSAALRTHLLSWT
jgi:hypothetical protein